MRAPKLSLCVQAGRLERKSKSHVTYVGLNLPIVDISLEPTQPTFLLCLPRPLLEHTASGVLLS